MLALYGHPFSSYTWKALIALYENETPFGFRVVDPDHPEHAATVADSSPLGKFPILFDEGVEVFEATAIIEYLDVHHPGPKPLIPRERILPLRCPRIVTARQPTMTDHLVRGRLTKPRRHRQTGSQQRRYPET